MALQGTLREMRVGDLVQLNCQEGKTARIEIMPSSGDRPAVLYLEGGQVMHATMGDREGEEVVYTALGWEEGTFTLEPDVHPPRRTIHTNYTSLLLRGLRRLDEGASLLPEDLRLPPLPATPATSSPAPEKKDLSEKVLQVKNVEGVSGVVFAAKDGVVLAQAIAGNPEKEAAVAVFLGYAAEQVGKTFRMGQMNWVTATLGKDTFLVIGWPEFYIGVVLLEGASPALVTSRIGALFEG